MNRLLRGLALNPFTLYPLMWLHRLPGLRRRALAYIHLRGTGLEIGALHNPMPVLPGVRVRYVDRLPETDLRTEYNEHADVPKTSIDMVEDAHVLPSVADGSQDFLIASHIIEHMESPLLALRNWLRVLRPGGMLYLAIPDRDRTFDRNRPVTAFSHVLDDLRNGPDGSREEHYREWMRQVGGLNEEQIRRRLPSALERRRSIHYHVWDPPAFLELLQRCRQELDFPLEIRVFEAIGNEMLVMCRKTKEALINIRASRSAGMHCHFQ
ncbi:MAG: methyltransferase domain-containing protein [Gammaproteobacteria bacterium]|nr:methyltransferase domain-containing protein [Gammaproteobacteria bacterium]